MADITEFLNVPTADGNDVIDLVKATVKGEVITTAPTKPGLVYSFREGTTLEGFRDKTPSATKVGDGTKWTPEITVRGGNAAFYAIGVGKGE